MASSEPEPIERIARALQIEEPIVSQTTFGERAAIEGILSRLKPTVALEIGTAEGGTLKRIASHSGNVHSFDLVAPDASVALLPNVTFHTGDNHELLPIFLKQFVEAGQQIDFAFVDGDHTADGVAQDLGDLLHSEATDQCIVLIHDTFNEEVRRGVLAAEINQFAKVRFFEPDFVVGHSGGTPEYAQALWGGLGLVVCDRMGLIPERPEFTWDFEDLFKIVDSVRLANGYRYVND